MRKASYLIPANKNKISDGLSNASPVPVTLSDLENKFVVRQQQLFPGADIYTVEMPVKFTLPPTVAPANVINLTPNFDGNIGDVVLIISAPRDLEYCGTIYAGVKIEDVQGGLPMFNSQYKSEIDKVDGWNVVRYDNSYLRYNLVDGYVCAPMILGAAEVPISQDDMPQHRLTTFNFDVLAQFSGDTTFVTLAPGDTLVNLSSGRRCIITKDGKVVVSEEDTLPLTSRLTEVDNKSKRLSGKKGIGVASAPVKVSSKPVKKVSKKR